MPSLTPRIDALESGKNLIINGNFDFWQRGITVTSGTTTYLADRFASQAQAAYTVTASRSTDVPSFAESGYSSQYSHLWTNGTGSAPVAAGYTHLNYRMEGLDYQQIHGRKVRMQFWAKSSVAGTFSLCLLNSSVTRSYVTPLVITSANTWEKKTFDIQMDTSGSWLFDSGLGLHIKIGMTSGSTFQTAVLNTWQSIDAEGITGQTQWGATTGATFQVAQVALIPGDFSSSPDADIAFARAGRSVQQELAMCQRYFWCPNSEPSSGVVTINYIGVGQCISTTVATVVFPMKESMRIPPVLAVTNLGQHALTVAAGSAVALNTITTDITEKDSIGIICTAVSGSLFAGNATRLYMNGTGGKIFLNSEL